jgi:cullin-associated NEDD8-dissociated protein 1
MTPSISTTVEIANKYTKYDPNYAGDDDMEEDDAGDVNGDDDADEEEEEDYADDYDDDDDVSWKVRRASVKVLNMALETRLEFLSLFYKSIAPQLIARFGEREETVKLEIWSTYTNLLKQTAIWAGNTGSPNGASANGMSAVSRAASEDGVNEGSRAASPVSSLKRKRDVQMEVDDS